ncbi:Glucodextranase, domain N [Candidatus Methylomirabilis lanthanidiphila]|uniref:Glucodextranase, domain N n=1 Tax=Candidatus Methylomirabilis lanthanidiphila TaxID=2211376 RepID=A0A564ZI51_9BACT|nr:hypothetical protein [Candidatus Methylomirabilis lanthanidiphila]VUZ85019.1 Glucodextranase, domain N [Candidatus Methylomirabilis lanthanidiphila]
MALFRGEREAFGRLGIEPRWTHGNKEGVGTAYAASSRIWFTLGRPTGSAMPLMWAHVQQETVQAPGDLEAEPSDPNCEEGMDPSDSGSGSLPAPLVAG